MRSLGNLTWREPRIVALALLVIVAAGLSALISIGRQEDPTITNIFATVTTVYPGAEPARVEALVTVEIEEALREIAEVDVIESTSAAGISIVSVELVETIAEDRIEQVWSEIRDALSDVAPSLPAGALEPEVGTDGAGAFGAIVALTPARDGMPLTLVGRYGEALGDVLRNVPGTSIVELYGLPEEEITVTLDAARAASLGLTATQVAQAVQAADAKLRAGAVTGASDELVVEVAGEIDSLARLSSIVLREGAEGRDAPPRRHRGHLAGPPTPWPRSRFRTVFRRAGGREARGRAPGRCLGGRRCGRRSPYSRRSFPAVSTPPSSSTSRPIPPSVWPRWARTWRSASGSWSRFSSSRSVSAPR
jgi:multidrug efflux pump subunit AcrB